jgi:hypothetical protein
MSIKIPRARRTPHKERGSTAQRRNFSKGTKLKNKGRRSGVSRSGAALSASQEVAERNFMDYNRIIPLTGW